MNTSENKALCSFLGVTQVPALAESCGHWFMPEVGLAH